MEKSNLKLYVNLLNKYEEEARMGITMIFSNDEKNLMKYMKQMAIQNEEVRKFLNELNDMTPEEREIAVDNYYAKKEGKNIIITLDDVKNYKEEIANKTKEERNKLNYLINNYSRLKIKGIRLDDLKYIDENDEIKDVDLNDNVVPFKSNNESSNIAKEELPSRLGRRYNEKEESDEDEVSPAPIDKPKKEKKTGFVSAILLFLFTGFAGGILAIILTLLLSK